MELWRLAQSEWGHLSRLPDSKTLATESLSLKRVLSADSPIRAHDSSHLWRSWARRVIARGCRLRMPGTRSRLVRFGVAATISRLDGTSVRRGGPLRVLRTPRITGREVAARNRRARVPAPQCARHAPCGTRQRRPVSPYVRKCDES